MILRCRGAIAVTSATVVALAAQSAIVNTDIRLGVLSAAARTGSGAAEEDRAPVASTQTLPARDPFVLVLVEDDAPIEISGARVIRNANGTPVVVRVSFRNRLAETLRVTTIDLFFFDDHHQLRFISSGVRSRPLAPRQAATAEVVVNRLDAKPDWKVVVAVREVVLTNGLWKADHLRERAEAILSHDRQGQGKPACSTTQPTRTNSRTNPSGRRQRVRRHGEASDEP